MKSSYVKDATFWNRDKKSIQSDYLCRPHVLKALGKVAGKVVLDAGCGSGYLSRKLAKKGAQVIGVDASLTLIEQARRYSSEIVYDIDDVRTLHKVQSNSVDVYLSVLVLDALSTFRDVTKTLQQAYRVLNSSGEAVFAVVHPFESIVHYKSKWVKFFGKPKSYWNEFFIKKVLYREDGQSFTVQNLHVPLGKLLSAITDCGLCIHSVIEPKLSDKDSQAKIPWQDEKVFPTYLIIIAKKR